MESIIHTFTIIPFFNEEENLINTCHSLGFGNGHHISENNHLILVNNNSTDGSKLIAEEMSKQQSIYLINENVQGIVPARHAGNLFAKKISHMFGVLDSNILILQADADTIYSENYIAVIKKKAKEVGGNKIIDAQTTYPKSFLKDYPLFLSKCEVIDSACENFFGPIEEDIILDDKSVSYLLKDYFYWGGHKREFNKNGDELLAETTRMFISAKALGATRVHTNLATVEHSIRNILKTPALVYATAGFPREESWISHFNNTINNGDLSWDRIKHIDDLRSLHLIAIFCILPAHVQNSMKLKFQKNRITEFAINMLPNRSANYNANLSGILIEDGFKFIEHQQTILLRLLKAK